MKLTSSSFIVFSPFIYYQKKNEQIFLEETINPCIKNGFDTCKTNSLYGLVLAYVFNIDGA